MKKLCPALISLSLFLQFTIAVACQSMHSPENTEKKASATSHCHHPSSAEKSRSTTQAESHEKVSSSKEFATANPFDSCPICKLGICIENTKLVFSQAPAKFDATEKLHSLFSLQEITAFTAVLPSASRAPPDVYAFIPLAEHKNWQAFFASFLI